MGPGCLSQLKRAVSSSASLGGKTHTDTPLCKQDSHKPYKPQTDWHTALLPQPEENYSLSAPNTGKHYSQSLSAPHTPYQQLLYQDNFH